MAADNPIVPLVTPLREHIRSGGLPGTLVMTGYTEVKADALMKIAEYEHAVPARQESLRYALLVAAVLVILYIFAPPAIEAIRGNTAGAGYLTAIILGGIGALGVGPSISAILNALNRRLG